MTSGYSPVSLTFPALTPDFLLIENKLIKASEECWQGSRKRQILGTVGEWKPLISVGSECHSNYGK